MSTLTGYACTLGHFVASTTQALQRIPHSLIAFIARFSIAAVFWQSGQTKVEGFALDFVSGTFEWGTPHLADSALYLFSHERSLQDYYLSQTLSGGVTLNDTLLHAGQHSLPFGGVGDSGMGHYHGREGFLTFSKLRPVFQQGLLRTVDFLQPPYGGLASKMLSVMLWRNR